LFLKSIEIQGFKSFPDKVNFDFGRGITAIVGPNGSGKSNIVDAIRWVLGEQSTKALRGGKMEDVIFGGTLKRRPMSFCQVTLVLDNGSGALPVEYSEVSVTRRYYRSGESEFYLNKKSVRLKDIHELFMDTGLGRDGYAIIGQGRIDEILSVKSADRREIFEEAAGITRFRYRKEESERRLFACEDNLTRIRDIIAELQGQVDPLREQADKARAFLFLRDELRVLEVSSWMDSLDKLKDSLQNAQTDFDNADRKLSQLRSAQEDLQAQSADLTEQMHRKDMETEAVRDQLSGLQERESRVLSDIAVGKNTLQINEDNIAGKERELAVQQDRGESLERQLDARRQARLGLLEQERALTAELSALNAQVEAAGHETRSISEKLDALSAGIGLGRLSLSEAQSRLSAAQTAQNELSSRESGIDGEREALEQRLESEGDRARTIGKHIAENEEKKQSADNMLRGFALRREARQTKTDELRAHLTRLHRERDAKADRRSLLSNMERDYEGFSHVVRRVMQAHARHELRNIHGPVSDLIETDEQFAIAIEIALGGSLQNIVVDSEQDGKAAINYLKQKDMGRGTFLPLTAVKARNQGRRNVENDMGFMGWAHELVRHDAQYTDLISSLLGGTAVVDTLDSAIACAKKHGYSFRIVTLDGQLISPSGAMTGGSLGKSAGVLSRAGEIRRLEGELEKLETQINDADKSLREAVRELEAATYEANVAEGEKRQAEDALLALAAEQSQHGALIETLQASLEALEREKSGLGERLTALSAAAQAEESAIAALQTKEAELQAEMDALSSASREHEEQAGTLSEQVQGCRESMAAVRAELESAAAAITEYEALLATMDGETADKAAIIETIRAQNALLRQNLLEQEAIAQNYTAEAEALRARIRAQSEEKMRLEGERARSDRDLQTRMNDIINMERERGRLENKKTQAEMESDNIIQKLWDSYELTRVTAAQVAVPIENVSKTNRRMGELKSEIRKLGDVNVSAIEEYAKVSERYEFLTGQLRDLEQAKADLLKIIDELTDNMKTIFAREFEKINDMFQQTFTDIFGGGAGHLKLEDESDILNCGIEIRVELPGKAMRAISLLSGGEKAFVAIALYFAIIKVRPTPFCVLDEIDAALDNVNVVRFSDYMRTLSAATQFIVITHRRGTMEGADILYGATMQEKGVTKLLSMNISEVEKQISVKPT